MKSVRIAAIALLLFALVGVSPTFAGAKIKIGDDSEIDLGIRIQALYMSTDSDLDGNGTFETMDDFRVRRGRIRLKATITEKVEAFLQTEVGSGSGGSGLDARVIDAYVNIKADKWAQFVMGVNMAPASRQNLTSSGALMAVDRPGTTYKALTWGGRALTKFSTATISDTNSGLSGEADVRDTGLTLFGSGDFGDELHLKYYAGIYDGIQGVSGQDSERMSGRVQLNFFDAEGGYYNSSTYLGKKRTIGVGLSFDQQSDVALDTMAMPVDYSLQELDFFLEWPVGDMAVTAEAAWQKLDFDDAAGYENSQGDGFYVQAGLYVSKWQPWLMYETWTSDDPGDVGSFDQYRIGVTRFIKGHNANIKLGLEQADFDVPITGMEDSITSLVLGFYTTY